MLRKIELTNFRGFRTAHIEFAPVTVLIGPNCSGKSTILDAVARMMEAVRATGTHRQLGEAITTLGGQAASAAMGLDLLDWKDDFTKSSEVSTPTLSLCGIFDGDKGITHGCVSARRSSDAEMDLAIETHWSSAKSLGVASRRPIPAPLRHISLLPDFERYEEDIEIGRAHV